MFLCLFFCIYQTLQIVLSPLILVYFIVRFCKKKPLGTWYERLGLVPHSRLLQGGLRGERPTSSDFVLWIHAVSVGEVLSIEHFIARYKHQNPHHIVYLTCGTTTGMQVAKKIGADQVSFMPFDFLLPMYSAFKRINPSSIVLVEAEIWPNFLMLAHYKKIPRYLLNGRINPTSAHKRRFIGFLYKLFTHIFVPSERAAEQFKTLGIPNKNISVLGDIKAFNVSEKRASLLAHAKTPRGVLGGNALSPSLSNNNFTIVLAGSIHPGELDIYLNSYINLKTKIPNLRLILVPRHFHWQQELIDKLTQQKISYKLWEDKTNPQDIYDIFTEHEVLVVCKMGVLFSLYPYTTMYCLGGTFVPVGGHNLLEPAVWAKPCLIGPYYHMCFDVAQALEIAGGLIKTTSAQELQDTLAQLAQNPAMCERMGKANKDWIQAQAEETKEKINDFIKSLKLT